MTESDNKAPDATALNDAGIRRLYNPELMTDESRLAWEKIPTLFTQNTELVRTVTGSEHVSAHFKGSTLIGVGGNRSQESDIDVVFYVGAPSLEYEDNYLKLCGEVYPGFAEDSPVSPGVKATMKEIFQEQDGRIATLAERLNFEDTFHVKLDGSIVPIDGLVTQIETINAKIEANGGKIEGLDLTDDEFWSVYLTANFLGSPSIFESDQGRDTHYRNKIVGTFLRSPEGKELYTNAVQPMFKKLIVNYEDNYHGDDPEGAARHQERVASAFDQVFERRNIPAEQQERATRVLRLQREGIGLPDYDQLQLESERLRSDD